jgi:hypothetical protein
MTSDAKFLDLNIARKLIAEENDGIAFVSARFGVKFTLFPLRRKELAAKKERLDKYHRQRLNLKAGADLPTQINNENFVRSFIGTVVADHWEGVRSGEQEVPFSEDNFVMVMTEIAPSLWEELVNFVLAEQQAHDDRMADASGKS